jgi:hypothetical protein
MTYHNSPVSVLQTNVGALLLRATDADHVYLSTEHRHEAVEDHVIVNGVEYWATLHIYREGTRATYWADQNTRPTNVVDGWEASYWRDAYMARGGLHADPSEAARRKFVSEVLAAASKYLNGDEGRELMKSAQTAAKVNEANKRAARVAALSQKINEERRALRSLAKAGYHADEDADEKADVEARSIFRDSYLEN